jgi:hypothetical protein
MPNRGAISNLPANAIAEVPTLVDRAGLQFTTVGEVPAQLAGYMYPHITQHELFIRAATEGRRDHVYQAAMADPLTAATLTIDQIVEMCDEMIAAHGDLLPKLDAKKTLVSGSGKTFKAVSGIAKLEQSYTPSEQMEMLKAGVMPLEAQRGRGIVIVKGISTSKEQISVTRIADHAVRGVKSVADLFIGTLNSPSGRSALKGKIEELLMRMESEGSLVPSTDGKEPAYLLDVYSSELDFAQGIVRVNVAVRPVRAMDYIYATIKVEA